MKNLKQLCYIAVILAIVAVVYPVSVAMAAGWVSPTGFGDPDTAWFDEPLAYDGNVTSYAACAGHAQNTWSSFLELTTSPIYCSRVRYYDHLGALVQQPYDKIDIDVYYNSSWHDLYEGDYSSGTVGFVELDLPVPRFVTAMRVRYYSIALLPSGEAAFEFGFYDEGSPGAPVLRMLIPSITGIGVVLAVLAIIGRANPHALLYAGVVGGVIFISVMALVNSML